MPLSPSIWPCLSRCARVLAINCFLLLAGIAALELAFGGWLRPSRLHMVGLMRDVSLQTPIGDLYPWPEPVVDYRRDRWGFRTETRQPSEIGILTVGGSTTDQRFLPEGHTWQDYLQRELALLGAFPGVANAGVDGQSTFGHLKNFPWWFSRVPGLRPRLILYYVGINDFVKQEPDKFDHFESIGGGWRAFVVENSAFIRAIRLLRGHLAARQTVGLTHQRMEFGSQDWVTHPLSSGHPERMQAHLEAYGSRLRALVESTRAFGAEPVLITQPTWWYRWDRGHLEGLSNVFLYGDAYCNGVDFHQMMGLLNQQTLAVAAATACPAIDLASHLTFTDGDFYDFGHNTPAGAEKIGRFLAPRILAIWREMEEPPVPPGRER